MDIILKKHEYGLLLKATAILVQYSQLFSEMMPDDLTKEDIEAAITGFCANVVEIEDALSEGRFEDLNEELEIISIITDL